MQVWSIGSLISIRLNSRKPLVKRFRTLVQNSLLNCTNVLLQSKIAELCNEGFPCEVYFDNFICSLSVQDQSARIIFPTARQLRWKLSASLLGELDLCFTSRQFTVWEKLNWWTSTKLRNFPLFSIDQQVKD